MKSLFSEFSYGFALTNEMVGVSNLQVAPIFPSLIEEGKRGVGYDVKLDAPGVPLFLQFKRSEFMVRGNAREKQLEPSLNVPFHRFPITPANESLQHASLFELDQTPNLVFYVAPRFHRVEHLNTAWSSGRVAAGSIFVRPQDIGPFHDDAQHTVAFDDVSSFVCSEPSPVDSFNLREVAELLQASIEKEDRPVRALVDEWVEIVDRAPLEAEHKERMWRKDRDYQDLPRALSHWPALGRETGSRALSISRGLIEPLPIRKPKEVEPNVAKLLKIADQSRLNFEAQFFVVQDRV